MDLHPVKSVYIHVPTNISELALTIHIHAGNVFAVLKGMVTDSGFHSVLLTSCKNTFHIQRRRKMHIHGKHSKVKPRQSTAQSPICA